VAYFICPNCKNRSIDNDGREGLLDEPPSCQRCGFGFLFELLDDYYPAPGAGFVVCDREARVLATGRGVFELTTKAGSRKPVTGDFFPAYDTDGGLLVAITPR